MRLSMRRSTFTDQESRAFLQRRVALAGLAAASLGGFFLAFRTVSMLADGTFRIEPSYWLHFLGVLSFVALWLAVRRKERSIAFTRRAEEIGVFAGCAAYTGMGMHIPQLAQPHLIVTLALTFMLVARAVYVPSSGRRTFWITAAIGIPLVATQYVHYGRTDPELLGHVSALEGHVVTAQDAATGMAANAAAWWVLTVATCTLASRVVYGLRREVRDARRLGQYTLVEKLGEGGMGAVYRARHAMLRRPTAVKLLPPDRAGERAIARFEREVQLTASLTHPNTVTIFDYGRTPDGIFYYAMELLDGATLGEVIDHDGPMPPERVIHVLRGACGALVEAHAVGLIHRDIKPANVMLVRQGGRVDVPKLLDLGLVKHMGGGAEEIALSTADAITGTPQYVAPEAITAPGSIDARSDLYALGAVGYYLLCGKHLFEGKTVVEVCSHHLHSPPPPLAERLGKPVPADLETLLMACLSKTPDDRPRSATVLLDRLDGCADAHGWTQAHARAWWDRHQAGLVAARPTRAAKSGEITIAVDPAQRS